ncbi:PorP/SprF family type IX secretion system membrane protein [Pontibacter harenae]|uniref:PorP/SprF family type IX secretion system membrane protein n=1 Tax=Pontibacter harenae TaxID=2894083 RepID=UPI001E290C38|nr:type IX secretion system membrane protein PorP/SprF [Pontibacter harenae]MCC9167356.1 type IX secretion system membrane protein PorP/SprF [Pontibacter harenae]
MKKPLFLFILLMVIAVQASAQQRPQYSQYLLNNFLLNPALSGIEDYADIRVSNRRQWMGLDGAPVTYYVTANTPLNKGAGSTKYHKALAHHGVGASIYTDKTGPLRQTSITGSYAYHMPLTNSINASAGVSAGLIRNSLNSSELELTNENDPLLGGGSINENMLDLNIGFWVYSRDFSIGIAGAQLLGDAEGLSAGENNDPNFDLQRHFFLTGSYRFSVTRDLDIIPSVMLKMATPSPLAVDVSARALYDERFYVGASYRHKDAIVGMLGLFISPTLDVGYSYDATISDLNRVSNGTHEIVVGIKLLNDRRIICPQWIW